MVYNDSDNPEPSGSFEDTPPQSDNDRYDGLNQWANLQNYEGTPLPKPFPGTRLIGFNDASLAQVISVHIDKAQKTLGRPPTTEEATALAYWTAKYASVSSSGPPIGLAFGLAQAYRTTPSFGFPFVKPDLKTFNPRVFPTSKFSLTTGTNAILSWHLLRAIAYGAVGAFVGTALFSSYAFSVVSVGQFKDKRLKDYIETIRIKGQNPRGGSPSHSQKPVFPGRPMKPAEGDNGSSTSDAYWESGSENPSGKEFTGADGPQESQIPTARPIPAAPRRGAQPPYTAEKDPFYGSANFDAASPTGGIGVTDDVASGESAWERIRRQGASGAEPQQDSSWQSRSTSGPETRRGSSKTATGQVSAREAAQREFDEQVERERHGGSFNGRA